MALKKNDIQLLEFNKACHDAVANQYSKKHMDIFNAVEQQRLTIELHELKNHLSIDSRVFVFGLGGLTGLYLATVSTDLYLHDTYFVVGHFHYTMAASVLLGGFAGTYFWFPKMFGRMMNETLGKLHFWISMIGLNGVFMGMMIVGYAGMHRRIYNPFVYEYLQKLIPINMLITYSARLS